MPDTGFPYVCTLNISFYTYAWSNASGFGYYNERGDDEFDVHNASSGVCTDVHYSYAHTNCPIKSAAQSIVSFFGCSSRAWGWGRSMCGAVLERTESDYVSAVHISEQSLDYPRDLITATQVNGEETALMTCSDSLDCHEKCKRLERSAHSGGLPAPETCALCTPPCPQDFVTSLSDFAAAFLHDVELVFRLGAACFGPSGGAANCFCNIMTLIRVRHTSIKPPS